MAFDRYGHYYRYRRENGRVRRVYVDGGEVGRQAADEDVARREERRRAKDQERVELARITDLQRLIADHGQGVEMLARATLIAAGFVLNSRGEWSRRSHARKG